MADATIIMAGGSGTRLWPASTPRSPKQLMRPGGGASLIQQAVTRAAAVTPTGPIVIVTHRDHVSGIRTHVEGLPGVDPGRITYLAEPIARNTAPAIAYAVWSLAERLGPDAAAIVLTADHVIEPVERFGADTDAAIELARQGYLVCFGIVPTRPETGYGYIESGDALGSGRAVAAFREKPDLATAERYLAHGGYFWNAGMFAFTLGRFRDELAASVPQIADAFSNAVPLASLDEEGLATLYAALPKISVDYAVMEKSRRVAVVPSTFSWNDVGSWDEAAALAERQASSPPDAARPTVIEIDAERNYVDSEIPVAICGASDLHVIVRNGKVLVCRRGASQLVKEAVERAERDGRVDFLTDGP